MSESKSTLGLDSGAGMDMDGLMNSGFFLITLKTKEEVDGKFDPMFVSRRKWEEEEKGKNTVSYYLGLWLTDSPFV